VSKHQQQADSEIHEDQLSLTSSSTDSTRKFLSNLANNAEIDPEDIYEVLVGATADGTSISTLCNSSENSPSANTILYHLRTKFEPKRLERVANTSFGRMSSNCSPSRWRSVQTSTCDPTTVTKTTQTASTTRKQSEEPLRSTPTPRSTHACGTNAYTLAVRRLEDGDTASSVAEFLGVLDGLDTEVKAVYLDRGFYDSKCLTLLQAHNYAYVVPIIRWGEAIQQELSEGWSRVIQHDLTGKLDGHSWTVEFPSTSTVRT